MKVGILTSSRADYGIYFPLFKVLLKDSFFRTEIIAFGTHLSKSHGYTLKEIEQDGFKVQHQIDSISKGDQPKDISDAIGKTIINFSEFWKENNYDLVFALGDRFEMFAAVASSVPFNIKIAHIHGGETTLGAIDEAFRHSITHMSCLHFPCTEIYKKRIIELSNSKKNIYNVGALSFDNLKKLKLLNVETFFKKYGVDFSKNTILITFHPETVSFEKNSLYIDELISALKELKNFQYLITMPNADTKNEVIRKKINTFIKTNKNAYGFENLGTIGYLSAMKHCTFVLGNTSSGCIEASYFPKWVINIGNRQKGRIVTKNMINCEIKKDQILKAVKKISHQPIPSKQNIYGDGNAASKIVNVLKRIYA